MKFPQRRTKKKHRKKKRSTTSTSAIKTAINKEVVKKEIKSKIKSIEKTHKIEGLKKSVPIPKRDAKYLPNLQLDSSCFDTSGKH